MIIICLCGKSAPCCLVLAHTKHALALVVSPAALCVSIIKSLLLIDSFHAFLLTSVRALLANLTSFLISSFFLLNIFLWHIFNTHFNSY